MTYLTHAAVDALVATLPAPGSFPAVDDLHAAAVRVAATGRGQLRRLGTSRGGEPIYHLRAGAGRVRALLVGSPHCMESIGHASLAALLALLERGEPKLLGDEVDWHIIPSIDPDGARLNEDWSRKPFDMARYMRHYHLQAPQDQVDTSFPIDHPLRCFDTPSPEARLLKALLDEIRPDFYFPLHNAWAGGAFFFSSRDIGAEPRRAIGAMLTALDFPLQNRPIWREICAPFAPGFVEIFSMRKYYDHLAAIGASADTLPGYGAASWDYLADIKPEALSFVAEAGYARHPADESDAPSGYRFRDLRLDLDARVKVLAREIATARAELAPLLDQSNAFARALEGGAVVPQDHAIAAGGPPLSRYPTAEIYADPRGNAEMSRGELFTAAIVDGGFQYLPTAYQFVRLLRVSPPEARIDAWIERLEARFDHFLKHLDLLVDFSAFVPFDPARLARVQLGAGLHALAALVTERNT